MLQAIQTIHQVSVVHPLQYWSGIIAWLVVLCAGWFTLGKMQLAAVVSPALARPRFSISWRLHPFAHSVLVQAGSISVLGRLESSDTHIGASVAVRVSY